MKKSLFNIGEGIKWLVLIGAICILIYFLNKHMVSWLDSDMASELILSKLLNMEKRILSMNWYYSTEVRVLNMQLVFAPLFSFTNDWHKVRIVGTVIILFVLLLSFLYVSIQLQLKNNQIFALILLCPLSFDYFTFVLSRVYYVSYIVIIFISLGLVAHITRNSFDDKKTIFLYVALSLLALGSGLSGFRQLIILYLPLFVSSVLYIYIYIYNSNFAHRF